MRIQGNLATYEFSDLLQWLAQGNKTGILTVSDGGVEYKLGFDHGRIDMSSSSDPGKRLDNYLHGKGVIDDATLARAERLRDATQMMSGQVLVTLGAVSEVQLAQALREKTEEILCELLTWDQGSFDFEGGERPEATMVPISLEVTKLLLESMHQLDQERSGQGVAEPEPEESFFEALEPDQPEVAPDATQVIDGLALAEVLDPASPPEPELVAEPELTSEPELTAEPEPVEKAEEIPSSQLPHFAAMAQNPGPVRRLAPYALIVVLSLAAGAFYLANRQASAESVGVGPEGEPILFSQTLGPPRTPVEPVVETPAPVQASAPAAAAPTQNLADVEAELRGRYEEELAGLRKELEEARRLAAQPATREAAARPGRGPEADLPADSVMRAVAARPDPAAARQLASTRPATSDPALLASQPASTRPASPDPASTARQLATSRPATADPAPSGATRAAPEPAVEKPARVPKPAVAVPAPPPAVEAEPEPEVETTPALRRSLAIVNPTLVTRPLPRYPPAARRHQRSATVRVRVLIGVDGKVQEIERIGPKAGLGFDRAAEDAAWGSVWQAGSRGGEPAALWAELRFEFRP
ncbi:MAG: DUF4388 domain-containing protein [Thermoanaerobaculia bacterium]